MNINELTHDTFGTPQNTGLIGLLARHPVAPNLLMALMIMAGVWGITKLNTQLLPSFNIDFATVRVAWSGASAEDVEKLITRPLEQELGNLDGLKGITSTSSDGYSVVSLKFDENTDMAAATEQAKELVNQVSTLPTSSQDPAVIRAVSYEPIAKVLITGSQPMQEMRQIAHQYKEELINRGVAKIDFSGMPLQEIAIQVPSATLRELGLSLDQIGRKISAASQDIPVGVVGRNDSARQVRFQSQRTDALAFETLPIITDEEGRLITLGDIAKIERRPRGKQVTITYKGQPSIILNLSRTGKGDTLKAAKILDEWLAETLPKVPHGLTLVSYDAQWTPIKERIDLLLRTGGGGLIMVVFILYLFLSARVAWWVSVGIPVSFMATLSILYLAGGSINMISLFALIMAMGIIVDDAIVVGEDTMTQYENGFTPIDAAEAGAWRMFAPVMSSSLTTIAAFSPLLLVGGAIGSMMSALPIVVICVIVASLIESFLILPGHLRISLQRGQYNKPSKMRRKLDTAFNYFKDKVFRPFVEIAVDYRWTTISLSLASLALSIGLILGGHLSFTFFPNSDGRTLTANIDFLVGTPADTVKEFLNEAERALYATEEELGEFIVTAITQHGFASSSGGARSGNNVGSIFVELTAPDSRSIRNREISDTWKSKLPKTIGIENVAILEPQTGPPGQDIQIRVTGRNVGSIKSAAVELKDLLNELPGVSGVEDDTPFGREQLVFSLTPTGESLGLTVEQVAQQLRAAYEGYSVHSVTGGNDELEVRVLLADEERNRLEGLQSLGIVLPDGDTVPIDIIVDSSSQRGFESLKRIEGELGITVFGDVDREVNNANRILAQLVESSLPKLSSKYGVEFSYEGRQADQDETVGDMKRGAIFALIMIYLVLSWVFGSYGWPLVVMAIIPFSLAGALWGHVVMGLEMTILSIFGFFGLAGIVVNDSIILLVVYKELRENGIAVLDAVIEASCRRLRAVLLTSLTTISGLLPLLFETSLQAKFLIPMATSIAFGLGFATLLVLVLVPSMLTIYEDAANWLNRSAKGDDVFNTL